MAGLRILITNFMLENRTGTELYVVDLARGLQRAGHHPMVWSPRVGGEIAAMLRQAGIPLTDRLESAMATPDVLHCHHTDETRAVLSRFPDRPGIYVQHDAEARVDVPPDHPRLLRYLAVDEVCRERLLARGIASSDVGIVNNSVDLDRFCRRGPLPDRPRRALIFGNLASEAAHLPVIREACERQGIELDVVGSGARKVMSSPETELGGYDIVFAKARAALEALAVGCAVVVADVRGVAGMVTSDVLPTWRRDNLGRKLLTGSHDVTRICAELARYDPADAARCTDYVRENAGLDAMVASLVSEYETVLKQWEHAPAADHRAELVAVAGSLGELGGLRERERRVAKDAARLKREGAALQPQITALRQRVVALTTERDKLRSDQSAASASLARTRRERDTARRRLRALRRSRTVRLRDWVLRPFSGSKRREKATP